MGGEVKINLGDKRRTAKPMCVYKRSKKKQKRRADKKR